MSSCTQFFFFDILINNIGKSNLINLMCVDILQIVCFLTLRNKYFSVHLLFVINFYFYMHYDLFMHVNLEAIKYL